MMSLKINEETTMKTLPYFFALVMLALGSCEEIVYEEILKRDTIYLDRPVQYITVATRDTVFIKDTVRIETVIKDTVINNIHTTDTILQVIVKDSLIIKVVEKEVRITDTVVVVNNIRDTIRITDTITEIQYQQRVVYLSTEYVFPGRNAFYIPDELMPYYNSYVQDAQSRGIQLPGGSLVVQFVPNEQIPGVGWVSFYTKMSGDQHIIFLDEGLLVGHAKSAMYRELSRMQLGKKYVTDVDKIMCPLFSVTAPVNTQKINELFQ